MAGRSVRSRCQMQYERMINLISSPLFDRNFKRVGKGIVYSVLISSLTSRRAARNRDFASVGLVEVFLTVYSFE